MHSKPNDIIKNSFLFVEKVYILVKYNISIIEVISIKRLNI